MDAFTSTLAIGGALALGAVSPGPSFVMVARAAIARSRADALYMALGMGLGGVVFAAAALLGLKLLLAAVPWLYMAMKVGGGIYLVYLGLRIWRGASVPLAMAAGAPAGGGSPAPGRGRALLSGFATQLSNPKTAVVYASVFAALLPAQVPAPLLLALPLMVFAIETGWYAMVAIALSSAGPRAFYLRFKLWLDRAAGGVMALLGIRLITSLRQ
ncbi:LysE family translocator [Cupriavidus sp. CV2]|uniref:LysE family translocator n=1 Tax=Cupriavidus ulmosensis TaxID=3065913 RepID=UPI00296AD1FD|nr:LysE family translocator [Cupriavidus sp. CV2]MDW3686251.1 LysE family translocator [Cupriavidus sp. CV2]